MSDPTCTHGGFTIRCVVGAFVCEGCGTRFVYESLFKNVAHAEHEAKRQLKAAQEEIAKWKLDFQWEQAAHLKRNKDLSAMQDERDAAQAEVERLKYENSKLDVQLRVGLTAELNHARYEAKAAKEDDRIQKERCDALQAQLDAEQARGTLFDLNALVKRLDAEREKTKVLREALLNLRSAQRAYMITRTGNKEAREVAGKLVAEMADDADAALAQAEEKP